MPNTLGEGGVVAALLAAATALGAFGREVFGWLKGWRDGAREAVKSDAQIARELRDELRKDIDDLRQQLLDERKTCDERIGRQEVRVKELEALCVSLASGKRLDAKGEAALASITAEG
jgi:Sec-independent protein translocase protein TatA